MGTYLPANRAVPEELKRKLAADALANGVAATSLRSGFPHTTVSNWRNKYCPHACPPRRKQQKLGPPRGRLRRLTSPVLRQVVLWQLRGASFDSPLQKKRVAHKYRLHEGEIDKLLEVYEAAAHVCVENNFLHGNRGRGSESNFGRML